MSVYYSPKFNETQLKSDGTLAVGYKIYTYAEGSSTPLTTYTTSAGSVAHANPIILNARGESDSQIWLTGGVRYKLVLTTDADVVVRTEDNVSGINDNTAPSLDQWQASGVTPTYVSGTSFTLTGDQTSIFHIGRRLKSSVTAGTIYSSITNSVFGAVTTITVSNDSGSLDSGLSSVSYGLLSYTNPSYPVPHAVAQGGTGLTSPGTSGNVLTSNGSAWVSSAPASITSDTMQATSSGTSFSFTGIPSTVKRITVMFQAVSLSGTDALLVQAIVGGSPVTSGYTATCVHVNTSSTTTGGSSTAGFNISQGGSAASTFSGSMVLTRLTGNTWVESYSGKASTTAASVGGGDVDLAGGLDGIKILATGANTFDGGYVNIMYE